MDKSWAIVKNDQNLLLFRGFKISKKKKFPHRWVHLNPCRRGEGVQWTWKSLFCNVCTKDVPTFDFPTFVIIFSSLLSFLPTALHGAQSHSSQIAATNSASSVLDQLPHQYWRHTPLLVVTHSPSALIFPTELDKISA
ncbi:hypothetical protein M427DRAFT_375772 [Gonapodya prolifera JEL478]|uniref:Uncharacterized protein n=1 Tax=Gonapodya prolifera (strain JEL478) TaxID=1344416 RepID=A0A139AUM7_GONPJ|nr:hypothetical protein M427DRAFT_375772 [Gonapodya prolifera JEL478]|eukprot:KXS20446.1 hypothetical protein M427DRAFT_375772 [Gonapodya prolifera JEL478]